MKSSFVEHGMIVKILVVMPVFCIRHKTYNNN